SALRKHVAGHIGHFPFTCPYCPYRTQYQTNLKHHVMCHEDIKPNHCPHCNFSSISLTELNSHMRTHTGEKPYSCNRCDYRVAHLNSLKVHLAICDPYRLELMKSRKKPPVKLLNLLDARRQLSGSDDDVSIGGTISSSSSDEDPEIESQQVTQNYNKTVSYPQNKIKSVYAFFDDDIFIGEYSV
ncbi:hypothetical protein GE061_017765, partial [Apolygus lucorum]